MLKYWSFWNFIWFLLYYFGFVQLTPSLKFTIVGCSVVGAFLTYIYPKNLIINYNSIEYKIPYALLLISDFFLHHIPLIYTIKHQSIKNSSPLYLLLVFLVWIMYLNYSKVNINNLYGFKFKFLLYPAIFFYFIYNMNYHFNYFSFIFDILNKLICYINL